MAMQRIALMCMFFAGIVAVASHGNLLRGSRESSSQPIDEWQQITTAKVNPEVEWIGETATQAVPLPNSFAQPVNQQVEWQSEPVASPMLPSAVAQPVLPVQWTPTSSQIVVAQQPNSFIRYATNVTLPSGTNFDAIAAKDKEWLGWLRSQGLKAGPPDLGCANCNEVRPETYLPGAVATGVLPATGALFDESKPSSVPTWRR
mmetsp:Transcript_67820/g.126690  ORF Transcript_67820/g.126690 Transcript_67820/m.126690 type:complete len:203 (-) Transcript_67820:99-707(-)